MTDHTIRSVVEHHSCFIDGIRYAFKVSWIAVPEYGDSTPARQLLLVDVLTSPGVSEEPSPLHLTVWITHVSELPSLLEASLRCRLLERRFNLLWRSSEWRCEYAPAGHAFGGTVNLYMGRALVTRQAVASLDDMLRVSSSWREAIRHTADAPRDN
jgi:hypothetical protein